MKIDFLSIIKCPKTNEKLNLIRETDNQVEIRTGYVMSSKAKYPIENGVLNFIDPKNEYLQQEIMHNISYFEMMKSTFSEVEFNKHLIEQVLGLNPPNYYDEYTRSSMDEILGNVNLENGAVLEIGGSTGRDLIKYFGKNNNICVEMDINPYLSLASDIIMNHHNVYFERVRADMNQLPFQNDQFDIVFGSATFHHIDNPSNCFKDIYRILKPGGTFYCLNERVLSSLNPEQKEVIAQEMEFSHEHAFFYQEWTTFLKNAGFSIEKVRPKYFTYSKIKERVYGNCKPKSFLGKIKYTYFNAMSYLNIKPTNLFVNFLQKQEDKYFANVPFYAICKKK